MRSTLAILLLLAGTAAAEESIKTTNVITFGTPSFEADLEAGDSCRIWFDGKLQTDCETSAQADRMFDFLRPMIDVYAAQERAKACEGEP